MNFDKIERKPAWKFAANRIVVDAVALDELLLAYADQAKELAELHKEFSESIESKARGLINLS